MSGYSNGEDHHIERARLNVPADLAKMIWPWIETEQKRLWAYRAKEEKNFRPTAESFFKLLLSLRTIIIQDAAAILIDDPSRAGHMLFTLPVFCSSEFHVSCHKFEKPLCQLR